ncbi:hypothetical protein G5V59_12440 [Nocardioides sp. W3-2-3]|uniref:hypothetical protein n=1 Tax=Nocardioides convexus TaxID=2712224 RepID=UPI0024186146|nr:hypothetical protein [Nocardioides convexus]NHA00556.1 hypothetical protein [Nocardioides convexus]
MRFYEQMTQQQIADETRRDAGAGLAAAAAHLHRPPPCGRWLRQQQRGLRDTRRRATGGDS